MGGGRRRGVGGRDRGLLLDGGLAAAFLILHGLEGSGPEHWQSWLAGRLRERDDHGDVAFPDLPDAAMPSVRHWLDALDAELAQLPAAKTTVLCHSLGCLLWLHWAAGRPAVQVARVLLVALVQPDEDEPESAGFQPGAVARGGVDVDRGSRNGRSADYCIGRYRVREHGRAAISS